MPTYKNNGSITYQVIDTDGIPQYVRPNESIETYEDLSGESDFTQTAATPTVNKSFNSGEASETGWIKPGGRLNVSVGGSEWTATVKLQRSFDGGTTALDVDSYTEATETSVEDDDPNVKYRLKATAFSAGTVTLRLSNTYAS